MSIIVLLQYNNINRINRNRDKNGLTMQIMSSAKREQVTFNAKLLTYSSNTFLEYIKMVNKHVITETHALYVTLSRQVIQI